jgi:hypothetical protein
MYWDIAFHIDEGRDTNVLTLPHLLILAGLQGVFAAALLHGVMSGPRGRGERRFAGGRLSFAPGGLQMLACGGVALLAFPLDDAWHRLFGEDVTLWGPTHLFMIGGAGLSTLGIWMLLRQGFELGEPRRVVRGAQFRAVGGLLIGLSTFQAEFDFGVPQFQLLYQPVLIAFAAGLALVCARSVLGPGGALKALVIFFAIRGGLALIVGVGLGFTVPHFPLYVAEALVVEAAALAVARRGGGPLAFPLAAGVGIGTVGLAAEWGWSHVWMPHPWTASLLPDAVLLALLAATGGALLGARIAGALRLPGERGAAATPRIPARAVALGAAAVVAAIAVPLPKGDGDGTRLALAPSPAGGGRVNLDVRVEPAASARGAEWFEVLSWQGTDRLEVTGMRRTGPGRYEPVRPVPASGSWKSLVRLARGKDLMAMPVYLPASPEGGRPAEQAVARSGPLPSDTFQLQREARGGPAWLTTLAYLLLLLVVCGWMAVTAWSVRLAERPAAARPGARPPAGRRVAATA